MSNKGYKQCSRCIMDNSSDDTISFISEGYCNYCVRALAIKDHVYFPNDTGRERLQALIDRLRKENKQNNFDCIMGISGGLDSSYLAYLGSFKWGLRILAVHVDDGFDTEVSKRNIDRISKFPNLQLRVVKPDRNQYNELIKAYMRAGVPNLAVPQDNVLFANVYKFMKENKLRTFLSGGNFALESILQAGNTHSAYDLRNLYHINKKFGKGTLDKLTLLSAFRKDIDAYLMGVETILPLNLIDYNRDRAMAELGDCCGFEYYGSKHLENELTKFIQQYWFYKKFRVDKRTSHLSSMIISGQMSREQAQEAYEQPLFEEGDMERTLSLVLNKLGMSKDELEEIMKEVPRAHSEYPISFYIKVKLYLKFLQVNRLKSNIYY